MTFSISRYLKVQYQDDESPVDKLFASLGILCKLFLCYALDALRDACVALVQNLGTIRVANVNQVQMFTCWLMSTSVTL